MVIISATRRLFSSVRLTIVLLFVIAVASIVGTFLPPKISLPLVYQSYWFIALLLLLCMNLFICAAERFRFRWLQLGFLITHFSLIFLLIGAVVALVMGERGYVTIWDGDKVDFFWPGEELRIQADKSKEDVGYPVDFTRRKPGKSFSENYDVRGTDLTLTVKRFLPDAHSKEEIVNASDQPRNPAMQVMLRLPSHETTTDKQWLFAADSSRDSYRLDIISVVYKWIVSEEQFKQETQSSESSKGLGQIVATADEKEIKLDIEVGKKYRLKGTKYAIKVLQYMPDFRIDTTARKAYSASDKPNNPAVHVEITGGKEPYKQWLFSKHPDMHMGGATAEGAPTLRFILRSVGVEVRLLDGPDIERTAVVKQDGQIVSQASFALKKPIPVQVGDSTLDVVALTYYPDAKTERTMFNGSHEENSPAINCVLHDGNFEQQFWLSFGQSQTIDTPAGPVTVAYTNNERPLHFEIALKRFEVTYYPNTRKPRSFKSFVIVSDEESGDTFDEVIETNDPLKYKGYRFFQSSYRDSGRGRMATVLSVRKDPGVGFIYVGFCMLTLGVMCTFYLNPILRRRRKRRAGGVKAPAESEKETPDLLQ